MSNKYVVYDNEVFERVNHPLFTTYRLQEVPEVPALEPKWYGKKIPLEMWNDILAFMKISYDKLKSETLLFLYYDENNAESPWSYWVPPQTTSGMSVKSDPTNPEFSKQRAAYPDTLFGTVHHHCSTSAFQSGTDEADETNREGFHFTIGNLNDKDSCDIHLRCTLGGICVDIDDLSLILPDMPSLFKKSIKTLTPKMQEVEMEYKHEQYAKLPDITKYNFDNELENVSKPVWKPLQTTTRYGASEHSRQAAFNYGDAYWQEPEMDPVKKSSEQLDEVVTTIILEIESDDKCEASICEYYAKFESKHSHYLVEDLIYGRAEDDEYERVISQMLHNDFFLSTPEGKYFESFVTDKCKQNKTTIDNVKNALFNYEIGETVQSMVDEAIL
jgi:hypothetical protein